MQLRSDVDSVELVTLDDLNATQMELLCELDYIKKAKDAAGLALKQYYAKELSRMFENGVEGKVATDKWKAKIYADLAVEDDKLAAQTQLAETKKTLFKTSNFYTLYRLYDRSRLFILRTLHIVATQTTSMSVIADPLSFASLASGLRLLVDTIMIFKPVFSPNEEEALLPWTQRARNQFNKDGRRKRMYNDLFWFPLNLLAIVLAPFTFGISLIVFKSVQLSGFAWDTTNERLKSSGAKKATDQKELLAKLNIHIDKLIDVKNTIQKTIDEKLALCDRLVVQVNLLEFDMASLSQVNQLCVLQTEIFNLQNRPAYRDAENEIQKYKIIRDQLVDAAKLERRKLYYNIVTTFMVLVGMAMFIFPPTSAIGLVMLIGASVTLASGSILNGLGKEIYDKVSSKLSAWFSKRQKKQVLPVTEEQVQKTIEPTHEHLTTTCIAESLIMGTKDISPRTFLGELTVETKDLPSYSRDDARSIATTEESPSSSVGSAISIYARRSSCTTTPNGANSGFNTTQETIPEYTGDQSPSYSSRKESLSTKEDFENPSIEGFHPGVAGVH